MRSLWIAYAAALAIIAGCGDKAADAGKDAKKSGPPATLVTVAKAQVRPLEVTEDAVGTLENIIDPRIGAEVAGRVIRVLAPPGKTVRKGDLLAEIDSVDQAIQARADDAEVARLAALLAQQDRIVERNTQLVRQNFISQNALDDATAQRSALREQLAAAKARLDGGRNTLKKTQVLSPIDGRVEQQIVAAGDYVKVGDPLFRLVGTQTLYAHLPFPEAAMTRIKVGMPVRLSSPLVPGKQIDAKITDIRPTITEASRAIDVIVQFDTDGSFIGGGTVNAQVVTSIKDKAVVVPEQSVVLRPAGKVVYVIADGKAAQRPVETGYKKGGLIEVVKGLAPGEVVAVDGAGFLTNNAPVAIPTPRGGGAKAGPPGAAKDGAAGNGDPKAAVNQ